MIKEWRPDHPTKPTTSRRRAEQQPDVSRPQYASKSNYLSPPSPPHCHLPLTSPKSSSNVNSLNRHRSTMCIVVDRREPAVIRDQIELLKPAVNNIAARRWLPTHAARHPVSDHYPPTTTKIPPPPITSRFRTQRGVQSVDEDRHAWSTRGAASSRRRCTRLTAGTETSATLGVKGLSECRRSILTANTDSDDQESTDIPVPLLTLDRVVSNPGHDISL